MQRLLPVSSSTASTPASSGSCTRSCSRRWRRACRRPAVGCCTPPSLADSRRRDRISTIERRPCITGSPPDRLGDPLHAGNLAAEVATRATERLAHESAVSIIDRALEVLAGAKATADRDRVEARLRLAHGRADFVATRNSDGIVQLYRSAALAEASDDPVTLAEAALVASLNRRHGLDDPELLRLLERAVCAARPSRRCCGPCCTSASRVCCRPRCATNTARRWRGSRPRRPRSDGAGRSGDRRDRGGSGVLGPDDAQSRLDLATRLVDDATQRLVGGGPSRWTGVLIEALNLRWAARVQLGDPAGSAPGREHGCRCRRRVGNHVPAQPGDDGPGDDPRHARRRRAGRTVGP